MHDFQRCLQSELLSAVVERCDVGELVAAGTGEGDELGIDVDSRRFQSRCLR